MERRQTLGLTMVEILVAVGILGFVVAGVMESFVVQNRAYTVVDQSTDLQQSSRAIATQLERDLRMTGYMVPEGVAVCGIDATSTSSLLPGSDIVYVTDGDPITLTVPGSAPAQWIQPVQVRSAGINSGYGGSATTYTLSMASVTLEGYGFYDTNADGTGDADFRIGGGIIVMDSSNPGRGTACGIVTDVRPGSNTLVVDFETSMGGGPGSYIAVPAHRYAATLDANTIDDDGNGVDDEATLTRNGVVLVSNVDDLQVAYFIDDNGDGAVSNDDEYEGSEGATSNYSSANTDHSELREIRVNLVLRSRNDDPRFQDGFMQARENRAAVGGADGFRRRVLTSTVKPRNLGFRGSDQLSG